jgi:hydroxylamine reductase
MFCNQCEQTAKGTGCDVSGVCGKKPDVAALQDHLLYALRSLALHADRIGRDAEIDRMAIEGLFSTVTNVDFDPERLAALIRRCHALKERAAAAAGALPGDVAAWQPAGDLAGMVAQGEGYGIDTWHADPDVRSVIRILVFGLKGMAAYLDHALTLGRRNDEVSAFVLRALAATADSSLGLMEFAGLALECGRHNLAVMGMLNAAHTDAYGHPEPTRVPTGTRGGRKGILVSGHDLKMLSALLEQTAGKGIDVYTHGEMLPANAYPGLKKHPHLAGHFGSAWQNQAREFPDFPGAIVFNTNCIQRPADAYRDRLFTWGLVAWPGIPHVDGWDFAPVIDKALASPDMLDAPGGEILAGFGHQAVLGAADAMVAAVRAGKIRRFFLIGGCDGAKPGRNYYTELAEKVPADCVILTLACGKFRFNRLDFGEIDGIPRLLDVGQCNDAYSAVRIAGALADAFGCGINDLPLTIILSWYEQKAVVVLLSLLSLGVRNIRLGPSLPAFVTPAVLAFLVDRFNIGPITTPEADLAASLARGA